jgi:threonylcarbamoyladenosine tRNA methylthiotransferase MtaB
MKTVAFHTLGCKVNQYDSQAMLEAFQNAGYTVRDFTQPSDVYVVNTCTVTGTGDKKSLQAVRRAQRLNPAAEVVIAGCLAQRDGEELLTTGARLVIGTQRRSDIVRLLEKAVAEGKQVAAVSDMKSVPYENLMISRQEGHTRAVLKIQEGCDRYCAYCIIPFVRGNIRSRDPADIAVEARRLRDAGFSEIILTGIHLTSYGRDLPGQSLLTAIAAVHGVRDIRRIRLGSLEPVIINREFVACLSALPKVCPQFHLSLQSGSDSVLQRMRRRYTAAEFLAAVDLLKEAFPSCAVTTDVLTGFPGETAEEFADTAAVCRKAGFARMHVFPFSPRKGTAAFGMPDQIPLHVRDARAQSLIGLGAELAGVYRSSMLGSIRSVLFEECDGPAARGYTPEYIQAEAEGGIPGRIMPVRILSLSPSGFFGRIEPGAQAEDD